jgi:hypothetical protein
MKQLIIISPWDWMDLVKSIDINFGPIDFI